MKKINLLSIVLLFSLAITIVISINIQSSLKDEISSLKKELEEYQTSVLLDHELFNQTKKYLEALMEGNASDFLSDRYLEEVKSITDENEKDNHHTTATLENLEIYNISIDPQPEGEYLVYVFYLAQLGGIDGEKVKENQYRNMILTTKLTFINDDGEYKVDKSELRPIDTSESFLKDMMR